MRLKRAKKYKKDLNIYEKQFKFHSPYKVIVDGSFLSFALNQKLDLKEILAKTLMAESEPLITPCSIKELSDLGEDSKTAANYGRRKVTLLKCYHSKCIPARDCISDVIGKFNKKSYCVASQEKALRVSLANVPGVPLIYLNHGVTILEPLSQSTIDLVDKREHKKTLPLAFEKSKLEESKEKIVKKKKKKTGNPNPLSCLKKKVKENKKEVKVQQ
jgi:U3 small nucleolar RNA-associated protein 23